MPLLRLKNPHRGECPPDGYRYVDPVDGWPNHSWTYFDWVEAAEKHLRINNREVPPDLGEQMQHQLCQTLPPGWCFYDDDNRMRPRASLDWNDVANGLKTFARWVTKGCRYVTQEEAERRALICTRCYLNIHVQGCSGCGAAVAELTRTRKTRQDNRLNSCGVCRCFLKAKVHFPLKSLDTLDEKAQTMYPEHCWLKQGGSNYVDDSPLPD